MEEREHPVIERILALSQQPEDSGREIRMDPRELRSARDIVDFMGEMPGGFLIYRADGGEEIIYANQGLLRIFRCESLEEFLAMTGGSFRGMVHPEDLDGVEASIRRQIREKQRDLDYVEYRVIRRDGVVRWIEDYGHFVHSPLVGDIFYVFLADATEKMERRRSENARLLQEKERSEQELLRRTEEYDRERAQMRQEHLRRLEVIEGLGVNYDSIFYVDLENGKILPYRLSRRVESAFSEPCHSQNYTEYFHKYILTWVHPEDQARVIRETDAERVREQLAAGPTCRLNYRVVDRGEVQYLQVRFVNVSQKEPPSQIVMGCRRMDEELRREMEQKQQLEEALRNAELSITAKNTFLSNMSHDMRTPLNAIFGYTALARNRLDDREAAAGYLDRIESSSRQLLDMIDKVLKLSWTDSNEARAEESPCCLGDILREVREFLLPQAEEKHLSFTLDCSEVRHDAIYGDREKLSQLVMYLANNAVTYTPDGGSVFITAVEDDELPHSFSVYRIIVRDTGIGIGEDFLQQIFEPFTRERNTTLSGVHGVGLGLAIAKNLADLLGGAIEVHSAVDQGSTFTVTLRLRTQPQAAGKETLPAAPSCRRILLVEDNEINLEIETEILGSLGFHLDTAADGRAALEKVRASAPGDYDLILMDIQMPVMDGWEATRAIRALDSPALAGIPIVALSANVFDSDIQKSLDAGMDAHLGKPVDVPLLLRTIEEAVGRRNAGKEAPGRTER